MSKGVIEDDGHLEQMGSDSLHLDVVITVIETDCEFWAL